MASGGLQWDPADYVSVDRLNQKDIFTGTATQIDAIKNTYPGMRVYCTQAGGINNLESDVLYIRNSQNTMWIKITRMNQEASTKQVTFSSPDSADWTDPVSVTVSSGGSETVVCNPNAPDNYYSMSANYNQREAERITDALLRNKALVSVKWYLAKGGSPTGNVECRIRKVSDDSIVATAINPLAASSLSESSYTRHTFNFPANTLTPNEDYRIVVEYPTGDASNYIKVGVHTGSGNTYAGGYREAYAGGWNITDTSHDFNTEIIFGSGDNIKDNNTSTKWTSLNEANRWAYVEVASTSKPTGAIRVFWGNSNETPTNYRIQHSNNGSSWTDLLTRNVKPPSNQWTTYEFNIVDCRYVRVLAQETLAMSNYEIDIYKQEAAQALADHGHALLT
jgi:hypothetical protein